MRNWLPRLVNRLHCPRPQKGLHKLHYSAHDSERIGKLYCSGVERIRRAGRQNNPPERSNQRESHGSTSHATSNAALSPG